MATENFWTLLTGHENLLGKVVAELPSELLHRFDLLRIAHPVAPVLARSGSFPTPVIESVKWRDARQLLDYSLSKLITHRFAGDLRTATGFAERITIQLKEHLTEFSPPKGETIPMAWLQVGITHLLTGELSKSISALTNARQLAHAYKDSLVERDAVGKLAVALILAGIPSEAQKMLMVAGLLPPPPPFFEASIQITEAVARALIHVDELSTSAEECVHALPSSDVADELWPFVLLARARYFLAVGRPLEAVGAIAHAEATHYIQDGSLADDIRTSLTIDGLLAMNDVTTALRQAEGATGSLSRISRARALICDGQMAQAGREYRRLLQRPIGESGPRVEIELLFLWIQASQGKSFDVYKSTWLVSRLLEGTFLRAFTTVPRRITDGLVNALEEPQLIAVKALIAPLHFAQEPEPKPQLTRAERRVLEALMRYKTTAEISEALFLAQGTVKAQLISVFRKLGVNSREEAVSIGLQLGIVSED